MFSLGVLSVPTHLPTASGRQAGAGCGLPASLTAGLTQTWQLAEKAGSFKSGKLWPPHLDSWMETFGGVCLQRQCFLKDATFSGASREDSQKGISKASWLRIGWYQGSHYLPVGPVPRNLPVHCVQVKDRPGQRNPVAEERAFAPMPSLP